VRSQLGLRISTVASKSVVVNTNRISAAEYSMHAIVVTTPTHSAVAISRSTGIDQDDDTIGPKLKQ
jgi:hypothetical protein